MVEGRRHCMIPNERDRGTKRQASKLGSKQDTDLNFAHLDNPE